MVTRLLASDYETESVLLDQRHADQYLSQIPVDVPVWLVPHEHIEQLLGFNFHRGVLACGCRPMQLQVRDDFGASPQANETLVAAIGVQDPENLGNILRCCAGLGIQRVIIGPGTADPLSRRVLRVSMGNALRLRLLHSRHIEADLFHLRKNFGVQIIATSLQEGSLPLESVARTGPCLILVGNERYGLPIEVQQAADTRVRIAMELGTDSLNVSMASGIVMHYFCRIARFAN